CLSSRRRHTRLSRYWSSDVCSSDLDLQADPTTGSFSVKGIGSTKKMCENIAGEATYFNMLPKANRYRISGSTLELFQNDLLLLRSEVRRVGKAINTLMHSLHLYRYY